MMNLTKPERKRLAKAARELAMECLENGPEMTDTWCGCAIGTSLKMSGIRSDRDWMYLDTLAQDLEAWFSYRECDEEGRGRDFLYRGILSSATRQRLDIYTPNPTAVVFPLLAFADELEEMK